MANGIRTRDESSTNSSVTATLWPPYFFTLLFSSLFKGNPFAFDGESQGFLMPAGTFENSSIHIREQSSLLALGSVPSIGIEPISTP